VSHSPHTARNDSIGPSAACRFTLPECALVVVMGGGVIGTSAAFQLADARVGVVPLERAQLGSGSTSKTAGAVRT
jgi:sarcosine oxidase, subunit beta